MTWHKGLERQRVIPPVSAVLAVKKAHSASILGFYFGTVLLWAIQTQLLSQIIANGVALIMTDRHKSKILKWVLFGLITTVNISVFCIWIPAHMPNAHHTWVTLNNIWERVEKSFFLILDLSLNLYFLHLVRSRLISGGLTKYWRLWKFNAGIVVVSLSMDVLLLGLLSYPDPYVSVCIFYHDHERGTNLLLTSYVQFAPLAYIVKLHIELTMAVLISKVVKSSGKERSDEWYPSSNQATRPHPGSHRDSAFPGSMKMNTLISGRTVDEPADGHHGPGIMRTVVTEVRTESGDESQEELVNVERLSQ
ncbi:hypothetical protein MW887_011427 [Aspergillus wentii]|nr:hypothetical protein MW887_011427 [Aspergillus wentii]